MSTASARTESPRKDASLRILVLDASPSCRLTIATADSAGECLERVEVIEGTRAELERHATATWDLMITHVHEPRIDDSSLTARSVEAELLGGLSRGRAGARPLGASRLLSGAIPGRMGILRKLFRRGKLTAFEQEERRATRTVVLAEIQREIGVALSATEMADFDTIGEIASRLKDDGANYNFAKLSGLGAALYDTVPNRDIRTARNIAQKLMTYMGKTIGHYAA
jgi:hypothetical protein